MKSLRQNSHLKLFPEPEASSCARPKILMVADPAEYGGAEHGLCHLLHGLPRAKYDVAILTHSKLPPRCPLHGDLKAELQRRGGLELRTPMRQWTGEWLQFQAFARDLQQRVAKTAQILRDQQIDVVVTHGLNLIEPALAARVCGVPHIWCLGEAIPDDPASAPLLRDQQLYPLIRELSFRVAVGSAAIKAAFDRHGSSAKVEMVDAALPEGEARQHVARMAQIIDHACAAERAAADESDWVAVLEIILHLKNLALSRCQLARQEATLFQKARAYLRAA